MLHTHLHILKSDKIEDSIKNVPCICSIYEDVKPYRKIKTVQYKLDTIPDDDNTVDVPIGPYEFKLNFINHPNVYYFNESRADPKYYLNKLPNFYLLNNDYTISIFGDTRISGKKFIRPLTSFKSFPGQVVDFSSQYEINIFKKTYNIFDGDLIMVSPPKTILQEWRFFIVNSLIVDYCKYEWPHETKVAILNPELQVQAEKDVFKLAQSIIKNGLFDGHTYLTLDIALTGDYEFKIVEVNPGVSSGIYSASKEKIFLALVENIMNVKDIFDLI